MATHHQLFSGSKSLQQAIDKHGIQKQVVAGSSILERRGVIRSVPIVLSGAIQVFRVDDDDSEILLYYLEPGQTCAATLSCCLGFRESSIRAEAVLDTELLLIPIELMDKWMATYPSWRHFVLKTFSTRFEELLGAVDELAFTDLQSRLEHNLLEKMRLYGPILTLTHRQLASELHTSRVVITRMLRALEASGIISQQRKLIEIAKPKLLGASYVRN